MASSLIPTEVLFQACEFYIHRIIELQEEKGYKASGASADSLEVKVAPNGIPFVSGDAIAWNVQETGRKPGKYPPYDPSKKTFPDILNWIRATKQQGRDRFGRFITNRSFAFLIARSLKERGSAIWRGEKEPVGLEDAKQEMLDIYVPKLATATAAAVLDKIDRVFKDTRSKNIKTRQR